MLRLCFGAITHVLIVTVVHSIVPCIVLSVLRHVKHCRAVYSVNTKTKANLSRKH